MNNNEIAAGSSDEILVSIICNAYNHEDYIADALDSFLMQKTNFKFEILVHDDASTDRTADIIREYEKNYPDLIKPIYQTENQYSQNKFRTIAKLQYKRAKGKYLAFCEGDDYWTDENKLQKQADFLKANPDYGLCVHTAEVVEADTKKIIYINSASDKDRDMSVDEIIVRWGSELATNSMMYSRELRSKYPEFLANAPVGDYPLTVYLSLCGKVRYMSDCMSAYRYMAKGSWSSRVMTDNAEAWKKRIKLLEDFKEIVKQIDDYSNFKYHKAVDEKILKYNTEIMQLMEKTGDMQNFKRIYAELPLKNKIIYQLDLHAPVIIKLYTKFKGIFK